MRQRAANQTVKKNFILYKGHTGWKVKTRLFGTLLVSLSAVAIAESMGTVNVHAAVGDAPVADTSSAPVPKTSGSATLKTDKVTPAKLDTTPDAESGDQESDANKAYSPVSISAESEDVSTDDTTETPTDSTTAKQYQTLTPDQPVQVGNTDDSGVTLSGSQVQDHFTNTVQNFNSKGEAGYLPKNKTAQPADENGVWHLTDKDGHDFTSATMPDYTMHNTKGPQVAHVSFENEIDFGHNFTMTGALGIGTKTSGGADSVGIVFAPGDPEYATGGETGGNLGLGGLDNAFAFVYDDHHNDGSDTSGVTDPGNDAYFGWRSTDADGVVQKVSDASTWKSASEFDLSNRATNPLIDFTMTYDALNKKLSVTIQNQTFTRILSNIDTSKGYSISIAASTGQDSNDYSARIDSFTYTPKTASVNVTVADSTGDNPVSTSTPVTANIGDTISVFSTKEAAERAVAADPTLDPSLVTVIPTSTTNNVYVVDGDQATASDGTVHYAANDSSIADAAYYSYKVTGDANQTFNVPISQAFTANVTPVDSVTGEPISGMNPIQVTSVAGKSVVIQFPGYTPVTVTLAAPAAGETVANDTVKVSTGTPVDATATPTDSDTASPIAHYYTASGTTLDGKTINAATVKVGTNQSVTDALNGQLATDGATVGITGDDYYWSTVPNAAGTDSTDEGKPQSSTSILVPTKATLDNLITKATENQKQADTQQAKAQSIYDKFIALTGVTQDQKDAAKKLLDSVTDLYDKISDANKSAQASLKAAEASTDPATIVQDGQDGYNAIANMDDSLSAFQTDLNNLTDASGDSLASFVPWKQTYGTLLKFPEVTFGSGFGATVTDAQKQAFNNPDYFYYVDALDSDTHVTPTNVGTYYFKLTNAGRSYLKSLTPDNPNAGFYVSATVTITPAAAAPTIQDATVVYGGNDGKLPEISGSLGTTVTGADDAFTQDDYEVVDADDNVVSVDQLQAGGNYTIRYTAAAQAALKADNNYTITDFGTGELTVTPRDITVTAPMVTKTYGDKEAIFELTSVSKGELVNGDSLSDLGVTLERGAGEDVGDYTITRNDASNLNKNYSITVTPGKLTIEKKPVTVTVNDVTATYDGSAPETDGFSVPDGALVGNDTSADLGVELNPVTQVDVGTYTDAITGTATPTSKNYDVTVMPGTLTITQAASSVDLNAATMVYGDALPTFTATDNVPGTTSTITQDDFEIVDATGKTVTASQVQANGQYTLQLTEAAKDRLNSENPNYAVTFGTNTLTVTQRPVSVTANNTGKTYGAKDPVLELTDTSTGTSTGLVAGDDLGVKLTRDSGEDVGPYAINKDSASNLNQNYTITFTPGTFKITPANGSVTVTGTSVIYGDSLPSLSVSVNGAAASAYSADNFEIVDTKTNSVVTANKLQADGSYKVQLTQAAQDALKKNNGNYALTFGTGDLTVTKRPITVNINNVTANYDGSVHGANGFSIAADDKLVDGDNDDALGITLNPISKTEVGTYDISGSADSTNYDVTLNAGTLKILGNDRDSKGNVTITEKDSNGNVVRIEKQWHDGTQTIYTNDNGTQTVTEKKGDQTLGTKTFTPDSDKLTLTDDENTNTVVTLDPTTNLPTFAHNTTTTNEAGDTTTTTDAEGNVVKVVKQWSDQSQTTYTYDPSNGQRTVTEEKAGQTSDSKTLGKDDTTATVSIRDNTQTIVNTGKPGTAPTFEHDTTETVTDKSGTTATTKDDAGKVVKVVKQWTDGSQTTYTDVNGQRTVTEEKDGKQVDQTTLGDTDTTATLKSGDGAQTIVNTDGPGTAPTFEHDTTETVTDKSGITTTTKDDAGNVIKVVKQWHDGTQTIYTNDNGKRTVTEKKDDQTLGTETFDSDSDKLTLTDDENTNTVVTLDSTTKLPVFAHHTTTTDGDTTTTTDAENNVVKVVKQWPDQSQTTYTYDPVTKAQTVTDEKDGKQIDQKTFATDPKTGITDTTATVSNGDDVQTIVNVAQPGAQPTFEHDTTATKKDDAGNITATTTDDANNIIKVVKQWHDGTQTTYTYDPVTKAQTVTDEKDGKVVGTKTFATDPKTGITTATVSNGNDVQTIVSVAQPGAQPTFEHDTTETKPDDAGHVTATTKDDAGNVIKVVKQWHDGTQTTYTFDPSTGKGVVSEQKDGKQAGDEQEISADLPKATLVDGNTSTIVSYDAATQLPTFEHDTTQKVDDTTTVTKDDAGNVIKVVKQWPDQSQTTYTYDPTSHRSTVTEENNGESTDHQIIPTDSTTTLKSGDGVETIVNTGQPGAMPTFGHETTTTVTDKLGNVTATTTDVDGDIIKVVQQWKDGSEAIYTNDHGQQMVTTQRNGKVVAQKPIAQEATDPDNPDATKVSEVTLPDGAGGTITVKLGQSAVAPTFTHAPAVSSAGVNAPETATDEQDADKIVKVTKSWSDGLQIVYTYDPVSGQRILRELKDGKLIEQRAIEPGVLSATLPDGKGGSTVVKFDETGTAPTFTRHLADKVSGRKVTSQKKVAKKDATNKVTTNKGKNLRKQSAVKPLVQSETSHGYVKQALAGDTITSERAQSQQLTEQQQAKQPQTTLPQTGQKNEGFLAQLGAILLALLVTPFVRRRSH